jgi:hypothetical protein
MTFTASRAAGGRGPTSSRWTRSAGPAAKPIPTEHFNPNAVRVEDEERVVAVTLVAILLGREVNVCAAFEAACVRLINLLSSVNLEGEVLDADVVVAVGAAVGWTQADTVKGSLPDKGDDLLRALCRSDTSSPRPIRAARAG